MPSCPNPDCPTPTDRRSDEVKFGAPIFSLFCACVLAYLCWGYERRNESPPLFVVVPFTLLVGTGLGVRVDASQIAGFLGGRDAP